MKKHLFIAVLGLAFNSCSDQEASAETSTVTSSDTKPYPLKVCIVSGEDLGSMGDAVSVVHEGRTIKFCCDKCVPKFNEDPSKYLSKLEAKPAD